MKTKQPLDGYLFTVGDYGDSELRLECDNSRIRVDAARLLTLVGYKPISLSYRVHLLEHGFKRLVVSVLQKGVKETRKDLIVLIKVPKSMSLRVVEQVLGVLKDGSERPNVTFVGSFTKLNQ